jgi:hypothetical protein
MKQPEPSLELTRRLRSLQEEQRSNRGGLPVSSLAMVAFGYLLYEVRSLATVVCFIGALVFVVGHCFVLAKCAREIGHIKAQLRDKGVMPEGI